MFTVFQSGCGFFPLQKFERVHVAFLNIDNLFDESSRIIRSGVSALLLKTKSRFVGLSPAILPKAQTAYYV